MLQYTGRSRTKKRQKTNRVTLKVLRKITFCDVLKNVLQRQIAKLFELRTFIQYILYERVPPPTF